MWGFEADLAIREGDYHYDEIEEKSIWLRIPCEGDLSCGIDDRTLDENGIRFQCFFFACTHPLKSRCIKGVHR